MPIAAAAVRASDLPEGSKDRSVVIAIVPRDTTVQQLAAIDGISPGVVSSGIGKVPPEQTYLDITQGNRINESLYDGDLPPLQVFEGVLPMVLWEHVLQRAEDVPADVRPGLMASTLLGDGVPVAVESEMGKPSLIAIDEQGRLPTVTRAACVSGHCEPGLTVMEASRDELKRLVAGLDPGDLLITLAEAPADDERLLPAGVAGTGYDGNLTSDSTRTDGIVLTSDIAPTVLERLGVDVPDEMNGTTLETTGEVDAQEVADLKEKLGDRPSRSVVVLYPLGIWLLLTGLAALVFRRRGAAVALELLALACAWTPALLLLDAGLDTTETASALIAGVGAPVLALATKMLLPRLWGLAFACLVTVGAHAIDVILGSPLTSLSVLGPNPGGGVRFFGIGNELEATLTTLTVIGTGAWLAARPEPSERRAALTFAGVAVLAIAAFAPGRFGADVGAAIVLGSGAATAAAVCLHLRTRTTILLIIGAGVAGLAALFAADAILGGAHLSRSVLGAGEASDVVDVFERRVRLMLNTFVHPVYPELLVAAVIMLVLGLVRRRQVSGWFHERWPARAGLAGAVAGVLIGTIANDSGSVLLVIGTIYLSVCTGYFWATIHACASPSSRLTPGPTRGA